MHGSAISSIDTEESAPRSWLLTLTCVALFTVACFAQFGMMQGSKDRVFYNAGGSHAEACRTTDATDSALQSLELLQGSNV